MHYWRRERHAVAAVAASLLIALGASATSANAGTTRKPAGTPPEVLANPGGFVAGNGNLTNARHVTWTSINSENVASLEPVWSVSLPGFGIYGAVSSNPIVSKGVVYFADARSNVYAVDTATGDVKWENTYNHVGLGQNGVTLANGRLLAGVDTDVLSLDAKTGKEKWRTTLNADDDAAVDMAPLAWKNLIIVSTIPFNVTRGIYQGGQKGVVFGLNAKTGKKVWSFDTTTNDLWGNPAVNSGGGLWSTPSIDNRGRMYMSVANPGPIMGTPEFPNGSSRPGKNLYTNSLVALDARTGRIKWHYQAVPHDIRDYDLQLPPILATFKIKGRSRDVVITGGKMGKVFVLDRNTGKLIWRRKVGKHNKWGDPARHFPTKEEGLSVTMYPGIAGGVETPMAVAGRYLYVPVANLCAKAIYPMVLASCDFHKGTGAILALDGATGRTVWKRPLPTMPDSGVTVVDDVLMTPGVDGTLYALEARTGKILASPFAGAGVNAPPAVTGRSMYIGAGVPNAQGNETAFTAWRLPQTRR